MKIIDKLIIMALGIALLHNVNWEIPYLPVLGLLAITYSVIYLIFKGIEDDE